VIDNLLSARIITGTLEHLTVSATTNVELFNAIRGGGSNFGVVTEFVFKAHDQKEPVWLGMIAVPIPTKDDIEKGGDILVDQVNRAAQKWYEEAGKTNQDSAIWLFYGYPFGEVGDTLKLM
jgi:FAD/FMN-containing dehydrogenase